MENPLISVIVPVYNGEKFIDRVMSSLVDQSPNQIEIILVNDGSTDNSSQLCHKYESKYLNVIVVDKENGGLSTARNAGMKVAKGEYISFVDVDDTMELNAYENIINVINIYNPDMIDFGFKYFSRHGEVTANINKINKNKILSKDYIFNYILPPLLNLKKDENNFIFDFAWNKIYKKVIISSNNITFNENRRTWEDRIFVVEFLKYANSYFSMSEYFYNYMDVIDSLSRKYDLNFFNIIIENYNIYYKLFSDMYDFNTQYVNNYWCSAIENMINRSLTEKNNKKIIKENIKRILLNDLVVKWYSSHTCFNKFDYLMRKLVINGKTSRALQLYEVEFFVNSTINFYQHKVISLKRILKKLIRGNR